MFSLDPKLEQDTLEIGAFDLCSVRLMNDARYPWIILVPQRDTVTEVYQLTEQEQIQLTKESSFVAKKLADLVSADKINIAALGNVVSQLHIHHVARFKQDETWPDPVWGKGKATRYSQQEIDIIVGQFKLELAELL